jgi:hypothetical protein
MEESKIPGRIQIHSQFRTLDLNHFTTDVPPLQLWSTSPAPLTNQDYLKKIYMPFTFPVQLILHCLSYITICFQILCAKLKEVKSVVMIT